MASCTPYLLDGALRILRDPYLLFPKLDGFDSIVIEEGATGLGFILSDGVMVAVDHAVQSSSPLPNNVCVLNSHLLITFSGRCPLLMDELFKALEKRCYDHECTTRIRASAAEVVPWVTKFLAECEDFKADRAASLGILVAGPALYKVDGKLKMHERPYFGTGSGSAARINLAVSPHYNMPVSEATELIKRSLCCSACHARENFGHVSVLYVGSDGYRQLVSKEYIGEVAKQPKPDFMELKVMRMLLAEDSEEKEYGDCVVEREG
ncbi:OLC1v1011431C1 [Oldenlandia corymbosa var. corymbosa]|uniref:OLC1v1011431C1 n=1 Tax=Oldenlandia corymbosa var. corymbosa TaxID=529605 RepID=A0AAV1DX32_OLDCO|nr:OLC1v1011431C1 [Oldenlandia corymbosa var. corymbosa]